MTIVPFILLSLFSQFTIIDSVDIGDFANGVAYGSGFVWAVDNGIDHVFKIDPSNMNIISSFSYPGGLDGLGYDGEYLWIGVWTSSIHKVDTTGTLIGSWASPGATYSYGMAYDGTYLWHSDKNVRTIYRLDYNNPTIVYESFVVSWEPRDLGWYGNHLWATANATTIYELEPSDMSVINSWPSGRSNTAGIALGGGYLWFGSNNSDRGMVYKVYLPLGLQEVAFKAITQYPDIVLEWTLTVQPEMAAFLIERKTAQDEYAVIKTIPCACTSPVRKSFSVVDETVSPGVLYHYKLTAVTSNGERVGLATTSAMIEHSEPTLHVAPNPFSSSTTILLSGMCERGRRGEGEIKIFDISGRLVQQLLIPGSQFPIASVEWDARDLVPGTYFVKLSSSTATVTEKVIRLR